LVYQKHQEIISWFYWKYCFNFNSDYYIFGSRIIHIYWSNNLRLETMSENQLVGLEWVNKAVEVSYDRYWFI